MITVLLALMLTVIVITRGSETNPIKQIIEVEAEPFPQTVLIEGVFTSEVRMEGIIPFC